MIINKIKIKLKIIFSFVLFVAVVIYSCSRRKKLTTKKEAITKGFNRKNIKPGWGKRKMKKEVDSRLEKIKKIVKKKGFYDQFYGEEKQPKKEKKQKKYISTKEKERVKQRRRKRKISQKNRCTFTCISRDGKENPFFKVSIEKKQNLFEEATIELKLGEEITHLKLPSGIILIGTATMKKNRCFIEITSARQGNQYSPCRLEIFGKDLQKGIPLKQREKSSYDEIEDDIINEILGEKKFSSIEKGLNHYRNARDFTILRGQSFFVKEKKKKKQYHHEEEMY